MAGRNTIAIDFGRRRFRALEASWQRGRLKVRRALVEPVPEELDAGDVKALGAWAGRQLKRAGFPRGRVVAVVPREHVVLKRLSLPTDDARELPQMTRLALQRDLPFDAGGAVIDFVVLDRAEAATTVMAAAAPARAVDELRQAVRAAGLKADCVSLRTMGAAALLRSLGDEGGTLAIDITGERVEFSVVVDGAIRFSRAGELPALDEHEAIARAVVTEARRTWMSYRIVEDAGDVRRAVVIGDPRVAASAAGAIGEILGVETRLLGDHGFVAEGEQDLGELWPLAGLLLAPDVHTPITDFANPRRAPDLASRKRQLILAGAGLTAVVFLAAMTVARLQLAGLQQRVETLQTQRSTEQPRYLRYGRDRYRLLHLRHWESAGAEWLEHFAHIVELAPPPDRLVLDTCAGSVAFQGVRFDRRSGRFSAPCEFRIVLEGEAVDRATADDFRARLVATELYEISTAGPDAPGGRRLPFGFQYHLRTTSRGPEPPEASPPAGEERAADGAPRAVAGGRLP